MKKRILIPILILLLLVGLYLTAVYSSIPFLAKWRRIYIETALGTLEHQWLATALLPDSVWKPVELELQQAEESQQGLRSQWSPEAPAAAEPVTDLHSFCALFPQVEPASLDRYLRSQPTALSNGWSKLQVFSDKGLGIYTTFGDELLAIDVPNQVLLVKAKWGGCTGVMAIAADAARLRLAPSSQLGTAGETTGQIASAHGAVLAIPGSAFRGANTGGSGGTLAGYAMYGGNSVGEHLAEGNKRLELRQNNRLYVLDAADPVNEACTDAVEFRPALIVDGEITVDERWAGLHPRVCIGQTERGEILMLVMEGRINGSSSLGAAVKDCAVFLQHYGCMQALNLDGGNSAMLWYNGHCVTRCSDPEHPEGRPVPTAFLYG